MTCGQVGETWDCQCEGGLWWAVSWREALQRRGSGVVREIY